MLSGGYCSLLLVPTFSLNVYGYPYICWDKHWSISSTDKLRKEKMLSIDISYIYGSFGKWKKKQAQVWDWKRKQA